MEIVKFVLCSVFIGRDGALAAEPATGGGEPARARNSDIVEDLGQVRHVFSDKTGTLTSNEMQLRAVAVKGEAYGDLGDEEDEGEGAAGPAGTDVDASVIPPPPRRPKLESFAAGGDAEAALEAFDPRLARATAAMRSAGFWREAADAGGSDADVLAMATSSPRAVAAAVAAAASSASSPALARLAASASPSSGLVSGGGRTSGGGWRASWMGGGNNSASESAAAVASATAAAATEAAASPESVSGGRSSPALDNDNDDDDNDPDNGHSPPAAVPTLNPAPVSARRRRLRALQGGRRAVSEGGGVGGAAFSSSSSDDSDDGGNVPAPSTATTPGAALPRPSFTDASPSTTMRTPGGGGRESATESARRPPLPPGAAAAAAQASAAAVAATPSQQQLRNAPGDELSAAVLGHHMLDFWSNVCLCHSLIVERHGSGGGGSGASVGEEATAAAAAATSGGDKGSGAKAPPPPVNTSPLYPAYQGPSPDEVALADAARRLGFEFVGRSRTHITLRVREVFLVFFLFLFAFFLSFDGRKNSLSFFKKKTLSSFSGPGPRRRPRAPQLPRVHLRARPHVRHHPFARRHDTAPRERVGRGPAPQAARVDRREPARGDAGEPQGVLFEGFADAAAGEQGAGRGGVEGVEREARGGGGDARWAR